MVKHDKWKSKTRRVASDLFTPENRPKTIHRLYEKCNDIPKVHIMDVYREDGVSCKNLYTDQQFFFRIMKIQIERMLEKEQEEIEEEIEARKKRKRMAKLKAANRNRVS